jgi:hypothetical protein
VEALRRASRMLMRCVVEQNGDPSMRDVWRRDVPVLEVVWQVSPVWVGSGMPSPPCRIGREMRGRS